MPTNSPPAEAARTLPVFQTVRETYSSVFTRYLGQLPSALAVPLILSLSAFALTYTTDLGKPLPVPQLEGSPVDSGPFDVIWALILAIASFAPYVLFSVAWTRLLLLGPGSGAPRLAPSWNRRHWRSVGYFLLVTIMVYIIVLLLAVLVFLLGWSLGKVFRIDQASTEAAVFTFGFFFLILFLFAYFYARWCLVFPAIAVDEAFGLRDSWRLTKGQAVRLVLAGILTTVPLFALSLIMIVLAVASIVGTFNAQDLSALYTLGSVFFALNILLGYLYIALLVSLISIAFRTVTGWVAPTTAIAEVFR